MAYSVRRFQIVAYALPILFCNAVPLQPAQAQMSADGIIKRMDADGDGRISAGEFRGKRRPFGFYDRNGDGFATREEIETALAGRPRSGSASAETPSARLDGQVPASQIDDATRCAIGRGRSCDIDLAIGRGLFETGLRPRFPDGLTCRNIDERWAISYGHKRSREAYHGGIDMPAPYGTPIIAAAAGTVVAKFVGENSYRGMEIILRHSPDDTGLPNWTYTQYAHFNAMPTLEVGQRVRMGEALGPTGNSGTSGSGGRGGKIRRPAIHFAVWFSTSPNYAVTAGTLIPADGQWMDPNALYRLTPPFNSEAMKALPDGAKEVLIPVMIDDGSTAPASTKLVWPYPCTRR